MKQYQLKEIVEIKYGKGLREQDRSPGKIPVYGSNGIVGYHKDVLIDFPSIIIGRKGSVGEINISDGSSWPIDTTFYVKVKEPDKVLLKYLYYQMKKLNISSLKITTGVPGINRTDILNLNVFIPSSLQTQKKIVAILERAEALRQKREEANEETESIIQNLFYEMFGNPLKNPKFPIKKLGEVCLTSSGGTPSRSKREYYEGDIPWVKSGELNKGIIFETEEKISKLGLEQSSAKYVESDTVLLAMYGATAGKSALLKIRATTNQAICAIVPKKDILNNLFLLYTLRVLEKHIISKSIGGGQPNISQGIIKDLEIILPPLPLQNQFAALVEKIESTKKKQEESSKDIDTLFDALMQKAFRGELVA